MIMKYTTFHGKKDILFISCYCVIVHVQCVCSNLIEPIVFSFILLRMTSKAQIPSEKKTAYSKNKMNDGSSRIEPAQVTEA